MAALQEIVALKAAYQTLLKRYMGHSELEARLERAMHILTTDRLYTWEWKGFDKFEVSKAASTADRTEAERYAIDIGRKTCTCIDAQKGNICKHRMACEMLSTVDNAMLAMKVAKAGVLCHD